MTNDVINTAEEQTESQTSAVESNNNNQSFDAGAAAKEQEVSTETADDRAVAKTEMVGTAEETAAEESETVESSAGETETAPAEQTETVKAEENAQPETASAQTTEKTETATAETTEKPAVEAKPSGSQETSGDVDFGSILEQYEQEQTAYHIGEVVQGRVVDVSERGVLIDFGYKSEGTVPLEEFFNAVGEVTVKRGDEVEVVIKNISSNEAPPVLSYTDAQNRLAWDVIEKAYNSSEPITGRITDKTKGGLKVDVKGVEAFLPGSQVDSRPVGNLDEFVGKDIEAKVIRFSRKRNNIVLSRKVLTDEIINEQKSATLGDIEEGYIVEGTVTNLTDYGAFVDIGGIDGLLHVTDMTWGRSQNPNDFFKVGEHVQVKVLKLDRGKEKVSLGYKQLLPDPWATVQELYPVGSRIHGKVSSVTDYGAFVELEPGVEGLIHISEMSWSKRVKHPKNLVRKNDDVEVQVLDIDLNERRISLGIKQLQPNPWDTVGERFQVGDKVRGRVRNLTDFGAFVEIEEGIEGLVHVSDITWSKKVKHPKDVLSKGQDVDAVITRLSAENRKISLSIKELTPSAWESFVATHKPGDVVHGKITRFANFGVFVELADELEGLCHISELSDERINDPEDQFKIGQELDFKILRIEPDTQKIGLSHRAVGKEDERQIDTKIYSTEAKGGMASLGELANLKFGKTEEVKEEPAGETETTVENQESAEQPEAERAAQEVSEETPAAETSEETEAEKPEEITEESAAVSESKQPTDESAAAAESEELAESGASAEAETAETAEQTTVETEKVETAEEIAPEEQAEEPVASSTEEVPTAESTQAETAADDDQTAETGTVESAETAASEETSEETAEVTAPEESTGETVESSAQEVSSAEAETVENSVEETDATAAESETLSQEEPADETADSQETETNEQAEEKSALS